MDFPIQMNAIRMGLSIIYLRGQRLEFHNYGIFKFGKIIWTAKSVDPDEMQHYAVFHLGLYCLQKYSFRGIQNTKG